MRILTKRKYQFGYGENKIITAGNYAIEDVPDWVVDDPLFKLAKADGDIEVMEEKPQIQVTEETKPKAATKKKAVDNKE